MNDVVTPASSRNARNAANFHLVLASCRYQRTRRGLEHELIVAVAADAFSGPVLDRLAGRIEALKMAVEGMAVAIPRLDDGMLDLKFDGDVE